MRTIDETVQDIEDIISTEEGVGLEYVTISRIRELLTQWADSIVDKCNEEMTGR